MWQLFRKSVNQNIAVFDFLVPTVAHHPPNRRYISTASPSQSPAPPPPPRDAVPKRRQPLSKEQRDFLDSA
ncbi:MAG: hypothetical protein Q9196_005567, partial [Gyalolechia fulgens]